MRAIELKGRQRGYIRRLMSQMFETIGEGKLCAGDRIAIIAREGVDVSEVKEILEDAGIKVLVDRW